MKIRIVLAEDHKIVREGIRLLLEREADFEITALADNGKIALELAGRHRPDLMVMDLSMPEMNGIEATRRIMAEFPEIRILALSMHSEKRFVQEVLNAGARGYLLKDCAFEELVGAIRIIMKGDIYLSPRIAGVVVEEYLRKGAAVDPLSLAALTSREREVLQQIADGKSTKEIAFDFNVSIKTVENSGAVPAGI